jgi:hypothetical protein
MTLLLTTPEQHSFEDPTLELDEKRLSKWLASLPVLNAGDSLRQVLGALEPLNEQRLDVDKRLRLMGLYQATPGYGRQCRASVSRYRQRFQDRDQGNPCSRDTATG